MELKEQIAKICNSATYHDGSRISWDLTSMRERANAMKKSDQILKLSDIKEALELLELANKADRMFKGKEISLKELMKLYLDGKLVKLSDKELLLGKTPETLHESICHDVHDARHWKSKNDIDAMATHIEGTFSMYGFKKVESL